MFLFFVFVFVGGTQETLSIWGTARYDPSLRIENQPNPTFYNYDDRTSFIQAIVPIGENPIYYSLFQNIPNVDGKGRNTLNPNLKQNVPKNIHKARKKSQEKPKIAYAPKFRKTKAGLDENFWTKWKHRTPKPETYDDGESPGEEIFKKTKDSFAKLDSDSDSNSNSDSNSDLTMENEENQSGSFVPYRMYAQVRKTENREHLPPSDSDDEFLRESIKDSKIHVVYSEEGYEDSAYDHADEEKNAERVEKHQKNDDDEEEDFPEPFSSAPDEYDEEETKMDAKTIDKSQKKTEEENTKDEEEDFPEHPPFPSAADGYDEEETNVDVKTIDESQKSEEENTHDFDKIDVKKIPNYQKFPNVKFGAKIQSKRQKRSPPIDDKYPYYTEKSNSALRYAENLLNIPDKRNDPMAFYNQADKIKCPDVSEPEPDGKKMEKLGDKIDCLKIKYFGEDPFDSPIFTERVDSSDAETNESDRLSKVLSEENFTELLPEAEPYIRRRTSPKRYHSRYVSSKPQIGNYKPQTERISEVHYKDEIKQNEQMNVLSDIINNIKNSNKNFETEPATTRVNPYRSRKRSPNGYKLRESSRPGGRNEIKKFTTSTTKPFYPTPVTYNIDGGFVPMFSEQEDFMDENHHSKKTRRRPTHQIKETTGPLNQIEETQLDEDLRQNRKKYQNHQPVYKNSETHDYVIGLRPPPKKPIHPHQMPYVKRRRPQRRRVYRRSTRKYAAIARENKKIEEPPEEEEDEEYVPHRNRNFHYDVEKKKIVYDKVEEDLPEYDYVEIEEPTAKPPEKKTEERRLVFPSKPPEGPTYIDFVKRLKSDPNYVLIPDPQPKKIDSGIETTTQPTATAPPEFLKILARVKSDGSYRPIEDPDPKTKATTTNPNDQSDVEAHNDEIFTDSAEIDEPKVKNYNPRTKVDILKYTSIERTPIKYNDEDASSSFKESSDSTTESITPIASTTTPTPKNKRIVLRGRRRFTTPTATTTETIRNRRNLQRSEDNLTVPKNHKTRYTPIKEEVVPSPSPRTITSDLLRHATTENVELLKNFDPNRKHGGNFKYKKIKIIVSREGDAPIVEKTNVVGTPFDFYSDPELATRVNRLKNSRSFAEEFYGDDEGENEDGEETNDDAYDGENEEFEEDFEDEGKAEVTTKKVAFIKDPGKRMYYYASV